MKNTILVLLGLVIGCTAAAIAYSANLESERKIAFYGGIISFCVSLEKENGERLYADTDCESFIRMAIEKDYFGQYETAQDVRIK